MVGAGGPEGAVGRPADRREGGRTAFNGKREDSAHAAGRSAGLGLGRSSANVERAGHCAELLDPPDARASEIDVDPTARPASSSPGPQTSERSGPEAGRKPKTSRGSREQADHIPPLLLARRLLVPAARPAGYPSPRKGFWAPDRPPCEAGIVEKQSARKRRDRAVALAPRPARSATTVSSIASTRWAP